MSQFNEPIEETFTEWFNPLDVEQVVDIREGDAPRPTRYRIPPGGSKSIPSRHDRVIHFVHNGVIIGGQAPQLVKRGGTDQLDEALNTDVAKRRRGEAELAQADLLKQTATEHAAVAAAKVTDADRKLRARETRVGGLPPDLAEKKPQGD